MEYSMTNYEMKIRTEWTCPKDINCDQIEYAFIYELSALLDSIGLTLNSPEHYENALASYTTQLNIDEIEQFLTLFKKFGVYKVESAFNHFELHAVAFNLQFGWSDGGYLYDVVVLKKTMYKKICGDGDQLLLTGVNNDYMPDMSYTEWMNVGE